MIYYLHESMTNHIKIGYTKDQRSLVNRVKSIQTGNSQVISLLGVKDGSFDDEAELHARFAQHRVRGEWFRCEGALMDYLDEMGILLVPSAVNPIEKQVSLAMNNLLFYSPEAIDARIEREKERGRQMALDTNRFTTQHIERQTSPEITDDNWHAIWMAELERRTGLTKEAV